MKITLTGEESLRIGPTPGQLTIEAASHDQSYSPFHMLGSALGTCTFSVLQSWASNKNIAVGDLKVGELDVRRRRAPYRHDEGGARLAEPGGGDVAEGNPRGERVRISIMGMVEIRGQDLSQTWAFIRHAIERSER